MSGYLIIIQLYCLLSHPVVSDSFYPHLMKSIFTWHFNFLIYRFKIWLFASINNACVVEKISWWRRNAFIICCFWRPWYTELSMFCIDTHIDNRVTSQWTIDMWKSLQNRLHILFNKLSHTTPRIKRKGYLNIEMTRIFAYVSLALPWQFLLVFFSYRKGELPELQNKLPIFCSKKWYSMNKCTILSASKGVKYLHQQ